MEGHVNEFRRRLLAPVMRGWVASLERTFTGIPRPRDAPQAHSPGRDSVRILILGGGAGIGWGVLSHALGLPGALARSLTARTGRGADVDVIARSSMTVRSAERHADVEAIHRYDVVVLTLGIRDAAQLTSPREWLRDLAALVDRMLLASAGTHIYLAGIEPLSTLPLFQTRLGALAGAQGRMLNAASAEFCAAREGITFVRLPATEPAEVGRFRSAADYDVWADFLAVQMVGNLPARRHSPGAGLAGRTVDETEDARHRALLSLNLIDTTPEERFDRIVALARSALGTTAAAFTVLDGERQWVKSVVGLPAMEVRRSSSFCSTTVLEPVALVVPDALLDARFTDNPLVTGGPRLRFYAGFPIESPAGERIGALCVYDVSPRAAEGFDVVLLRELALVLQNELWQPAPRPATAPGPSSAALPGGAGQ
jgi:hypothetical protein